MRRLNSTMIAPSAWVSTVLGGLSRIGGIDGDGALAPFQDGFGGEAVLGGAVQGSNGAADGMTAEGAIGFESAQVHRCHRSVRVVEERRSNRASPYPSTPKRTKIRHYDVSEGDRATGSSVAYWTEFSLHRQTQSFGKTTDLKVF